jgi:hypothetical protein
MSWNARQEAAVSRRGVPTQRQRRIFWRVELLWLHVFEL